MANIKYCVVLSLFFISSILAATVNFNVSQEVNCLQSTGGCAFNDANIWENNQIPTDDDDVVIYGSGLTNSSLYIYISNNVTTLNSLNISNVNFVVDNNCSLMINDNGLYFGNNSVFTSSQYATVIVFDGFVNFPLFLSTTLNVYGAFVVYLLYLHFVKNIYNTI